MSSARAYLLGLLLAGSHGSIPAQAPAGWTLTSVQQIRSLTSERAKLALPVHLRGLATTVSGWKNSFFFYDKTGSISVNRDEPENNVHSGDLVEVEGVTNPGLFAPTIVAKHVRVTGSSPLPFAPLVAFPRLEGGSQDSQWIAVRGVVRSVEISKMWEHRILALLVDTGEGQVKGLVLQYAGDPHRFLDAVIEMRGACGTAFNERRQFVSASLFVPSLESITVQVPGNPDPFLSPQQPLDSLLSFAGDAIQRRIKVRGSVTHQRLGQSIYLQDKGRGLLVYTASNTVLPLGSLVEAAGFAARGTYSPVMENAVIRVTGRGPPVAPLTFGTKKRDSER